MRFIEFLLTEVEMNLSFNPDKESTQDIVAKAKQASRMGAANPQRAIRQRQLNIKDKLHSIAASDDPLEPQRIAIAKLEEKIAKMKMALARKEEAMKKSQTTGATTGMTPGAV
jgi:hypothetical protein